MGFFKDIGTGINNKVQQIFEKRAKEKEFEDNLRREQRLLEKTELEKAFRDSARKASVIKAQREADKMTGLSKLRAINRVHEMKNNENKKPFFDGLSEYMQRNIQRREANLEKTRKLREEAERMKQNKTSIPRRQSFQKDESFSKSKKPFSDLGRGIVRY